MVILWIAGANLAVPIETETYLVELLAIAVDVGHGSYLWMLTGLDGILLGWQTVCVVTHWVKHVESVQALVAGIDVAGYIAQGMAYMQACSRWIGEHVEHIEFLFVFILDNLIGLVLDPFLMPFLLDLSEVVFHCFLSCLFCFLFLLFLMSCEELAPIYIKV